MKLLAAPILAALALSFSGCAELPANATAKDRALAAIKSAENWAKPSAATATTAFLLLRRDPAVRTQDAHYIYAGAVALRTLSTGSTPTPEQLDAWVATFLKGDPNAGLIGKPLCRALRPTASQEIATTHPCLAQPRWQVQGEQGRVVHLPRHAHYQSGDRLVLVD